MSATQTQPQPNTLSQAASQFVDYRVQPDPVRTSRMTTEELRGAYLIDRLFEPGRVCLYYLDFDRAVVGGAVPTSSPLRLEADYQHMAVTTFLERRELGVMNIGAPGTVTVDGTVYPMSADEVLYVGRGATDVFFSSDNAAAPARFYLVSYPAHAIYPTTHATLADANLIRLGSKESCNERLLYQFIHPDGIKSCQLDFGFTRLQPGSVWNTMPFFNDTGSSEIYSV